MKVNKTIVWSLVLLVVVCALYRVIPNRPFGFAPQLAMALFAGVTIKDRKWALVLPVLSMFLSDLLYQVLYQNGLYALPGFYEGQWQNYLLFALMACIGFLVKKVTVPSVLAGVIAVATVYFILSNFIVWSGWSGSRGLGRPKTWEGLLQCYTDALPFYKWSVAATLVFSIIFFGAWFLVKRDARSANTLRPKAINA